MRATPLPPNLMADIEYPLEPPYPSTRQFPVRADYENADRARDTYQNQPHMLVGCSERTIDVYACPSRRLIQLGHVKYMVSRGTWQVWYDYPHSTYLQQMSGPESPNASHGVQRILEQAYTDTPGWRNLPIFRSTH